MTDKPNFVLVRGAFADGSHWRPYQARLRRPSNGTGGRYTHCAVTRGCRWASAVETWTWPNGNDGGMSQTNAASRPDPVRLIWYTFGGGLGLPYREWVLHDVTSRTRRVRQVARTIVQTAAIAAILLLVFGFGWITWLLLISRILFALICHVAFSDAFAEHRLFQHGYAWGTAQCIVNEHDRRTIQIGYAGSHTVTAPILGTRSPQRLGDDSEESVIFGNDRSTAATAPLPRSAHRLRLRTSHIEHVGPQRPSRYRTLSGRDRIVQV
jgi:Family of unknown function (DUF5313)